MPTFEPETPTGPPEQPRPARLPSVSDYWPDLPHRIGPPADYYAETPALPPPARPAPAPVPIGAPPVAPRRRRPVLLVLCLAALIAAGVAAVAIRRPWSDTEVRREARPPAAPPAAAPRFVTPRSAAPDPATASAPAGELRRATFVLASDAVRVRLRTGDLAGDLYRITAAADSSVRPSATVQDGTVRLSLVDTGRRGSPTVDITLAAEVRWSLRIDGGLSNGDLDLSGARVTQVRLAGDAADLRLAMPAPDGTVGVRVTGGINRLRVTVPGRTPMRVRTRGGAGEVVLDGRTERGVARNRSFQTDGWRAGDDGVDIDATTGLGALRAERRG
jgi:hypothetical protein